MKPPRSLTRIAAGTQVHPSAAPLFLPGQAGQPGILMIHGFTGGPFDLEWLAKGLNSSGWTVSVPRLPGHGTSGEDFLHSTDRDWLRAGIDAFMELKRSCPRISIVGHSMGGLIACILASMFQIDRLILLAPALALNHPGLRLSPVLGRFIRHIPLPASLIDYPDRRTNKPELTEILYEYKRSVWVRPAAYLRRIQRLAQSRLSAIQAPTLTVLGALDKTVPYDAGYRVANAISSQDQHTVILRQSGHVLPDDQERETLLQLLVDCLTFSG